MTVLMVPTEQDRYPSLGGLVCQFIEQNLVFGPGDLHGEPAFLTPEKRGLVWALYEVYPEGHEFEGRRRYKRAAISLRKGSAKTELAAWIAAVELHPAGPVRFDGWNTDGTPRGRPIRDPYIAMVSYDQEQTELLAYGALYEILQQSPIAADFDIGLERILRRFGNGRAEALSSSPSARDGARTTFQHFDETHRMVTPRLKETHQTMLANIAKRMLADGWSLETTTAPEPGQGSVAEGTMEYAQAVIEQRAEGRDFFFFHREAGDGHDLSTREAARAALEEASGGDIGWTDVQAIMGLWEDPNYPRTSWERFWCNRKVHGEGKAFDLAVWDSLARDDFPVRDGDLITLGFDGAMFRDATALVGTHVETGFQWVLGVWECPFGAREWQVPEEEVDDAVAAAFQRYKVWRMYADPPYWQAWLSLWAGRHGKDVVVEWPTNRPSKMAASLEAYSTAMQTGSLSQDGHEAFRRHIGNAHRQDLKTRDEDDLPQWYIRKERSDSPLKIDLAMAGCLSWEAYMDCVAAGPPSPQSYYETHELTIL